MQRKNLAFILFQSAVLTIKSFLPVIPSFTPLSFCRHRSIIRISSCRYSTQITSRLSMNSNAEQLVETSLNRSNFDRLVPLMCLKIPVKDCSEYMKVFKDYGWKQPKMKRIHEVPDDKTLRFFLLSEELKDTTLTGLPNDLKDFIKHKNAEICTYTMKIGYEHLAVEDVLKKILPEGIEIPSSFEQAGHIAHMNLRPEVLPFKTIIGQVILDKNPAIRTVVNKLGNIASEFRTFPMELLAGKDDYLVTLRESNANFTFNFCDVYWNSRLQTEHLRLIDFIKSIHSKRGSVMIADMMAGVGPFAVPLAMAGCKVYANDLNPASYKYLVENSKKNHCGDNLLSFNTDGRIFILNLQSMGINVDHVIMNLPQNATDFLDVFIGYTVRRQRMSGQLLQSLPTIHVYGFSSAEDPVMDLAIRASESLQCSLSDLAALVVSTTLLGINGVSGPGEFEVITSALYDKGQAVGHPVRDVAPKKIMICLSFVLPACVANAEPIVHIEEMNNKRKVTAATTDILDDLGEGQTKSTKRNTQQADGPTTT